MAWRTRCAGPFQPQALLPHSCAVPKRATLAQARKRPKPKLPPARNDRANGARAQRLHHPRRRTRHDHDCGRHAPRLGDHVPSGSPHSDVPLEPWLVGKAKSMHKQLCQMADGHIRRGIACSRDVAFSFGQTFFLSPPLFLFLWPLPTYRKKAVPKRGNLSVVEWRCSSIART